MRQLRPVGGHPIQAGHRPDRHHVFIRPLIPHHAHRPNREQHREGLPQLPVEPGVPDFLLHDRICLPQHGQPLPGHGSEYPDGQAGAGKRLPPDHVVWQAYLFPQ